LTQQKLRDILSGLTKTTPEKENEMEHEPQCKKQSDVFREIARVLDMCSPSGDDTVKAWRYKGETFGIVLEAARAAEFSKLEFAVAIVGKTPVFIGDTVYLNGDSAGCVVVSEMNNHLVVNQGGTTREAHVYHLSTTPPKPTTITLTDVPMPTRTRWIPHGPTHLLLDFNTAAERGEFSRRVNEAMV
jgi:hypothetical protein